MARAIPIGWPGLIGKCSIFLGYSHWSLTGRFGIMKAPNISNHLSPKILCALLLMMSKADRLPLKTESVARNKNTIVVLKNKLGQKRFIILLSVKKSVEVYPGPKLRISICMKASKLLTLFYPACFVTILAWKKTFFLHHVAWSNSLALPYFCQLD